LNIYNYENNIYYRRCGDADGALMMIESIPNVETRPFKLRYNLIYQLELLSNDVMEDWLFDKGCDDNISSGLQTIFGNIAKEHCLDKPMEEIIGTILYNSEEADLMSGLANAINTLKTNIGINKPDEEYVNSKEFDIVIKAAKLAFDLLSKNHTAFTEYYFKDYVYGRVLTIDGKLEDRSNEGTSYFHA